MFPSFLKMSASVSSPFESFPPVFLFLIQFDIPVGYSFDYVPTHFVKDLLVHEAHRHPYIERLAQIYLMKLRHKAFVSDAGAAWRQLIVVTLFPWLTKYRLFNEERVTQPLQILKERQHEEGNGEEVNTGDPGGKLLLTETKVVATEPNTLRTS
jgi:hypothetical protein